MKFFKMIKNNNHKKINKKIMLIIWIVYIKMLINKLHKIKIQIFIMIYNIKLKINIKVVSK